MKMQIKKIASIALVLGALSGCASKQQMVYTETYKGKPVHILITKDLADELVIVPGSLNENEVKARAMLASADNEFRNDSNGMEFPPGDYIFIVQQVNDSARYPKPGRPIDLSKKIVLEIDGKNKPVYCEFHSSYSKDLGSLATIYFKEIGCEIDKETIYKMAKSAQPVYIKFSGKNGYKGKFVLKEDVKPKLMAHYKYKKAK
ncbi:hypothetical protein MNB_SM-7-9 [hydrothermal vent metagenome]|uniref:Lipoprotein n=1 Tax=hydrothermal vent metagenome TaxID=652676 RepID=A0A1W1BH20_9ZZZZ